MMTKLESITNAKRIHLERLKTDPVYRRTYCRNLRLGWRRKQRAEAKATVQPTRRGRFSYVQRAIMTLDKQITHLQTKREALVVAQQVIDETVR